MSEFPRISAMLVDDEPDMRILVRTVLDLSVGDFHVVGEAADGEEAVALYDTLAPPPDPTVVILDNRMPRLTGLEAAEQILSRRPDQIVVLYSAQLDDATKAAAARLGVARCLHKEDLETIPEILSEIVSA